MKAGFVKLYETNRTDEGIRTVTADYFWERKATFFFPEKTGKLLLENSKHMYNLKNLAYV